MKRIVISLSLVFLLVTLCFYITWLNILLLVLVLVISLYIILVGGIKKLLGKDFSKFFRFPLRLIVICSIAIVISFFIPYSPAILDTGGVSEELEYAYETDQADRKNLKSYIGFFKNKIQSRDKLRLDQVRKFYFEGKITKPLDKFHAAFIYHHSNNSGDYEIATKLATEAANTEDLKDHYLAQWLAKASYDRLMVSTGRPEKFGTQDSFSLEVE